ncbi:MAG: ATP-binding cassette domain-containing protein [Bacilli bacterium]|nr:ATP-binding cassette domain-containing protein [Bacilli bacterium]
MENKEIVLSVKDLRVNFSTDHGYVQAVRGVSFDLYKGETLCIVGESGSGKSVTSKTIMGILSANGRIMGGSIMYEGEDLTKVSEDEFHRIRGHKIGMIFQDPLSSLNPIVRIGKQITEAMLINSSRLKKKYEDLVATELVAYKNAQTEYKMALNNRKERIKFLKSEKKKEIESARNEPFMTRSGKLYTLSLEYNGKVLHVKETAKEEIKALDEELLAMGENKDEVRVNEINARKEEIKAKMDEDLAALKEQNALDKAAINEEIAAIRAEVPNKINAIKDKYTALIAEVDASNTDSKKSLKEKYLPVIKETKAAFTVRSKEAKVEVKKYANELKKEYLANCEKIKAEHADNPEECKKLLAEEKSRYVSSIKITKAEAKARALKIMSEVGISNPEKRYNQYPFEFSGGMRQRIVIAIALTADPDILICDEPTTALDVTIQAQILELINRLKRERNISCIFITHDLGVVANMADRVAVMYAGKIVEYGTEDDIFYDPRHPYTWALLSSIPDINSKEKLEAIPGTPPNMIYPPVGDAFALRSKYAMAIDFKKEPPLFKISDTHYAATWLLDPRAPKVEMPKIVKTRIENSLKAAKGGKVND